MCLPLLAPLGVAMGASATSAAAVGTVTAVSLAASAVGAYAGIKSGMDANDAASSNANIQRQTAISHENSAAEQAAQQKIKIRKIASSQTAASAAGGVLTDTGTPGQLTKETAAFGELDALRITTNAQRQAWGYQSQANNEEWQGKQQQTAGFLSAGASLLGGASNAYFGYKKMTN